MRIDRVLAPNPGLFTGPGTNTYVVGDEAGVAVIDPGPIDTSHEAAIVRAVGGRTVTGVIVTHTHPDHAPLANPLATALAVPTFGYDRGPEFEPDVRIEDGTRCMAGGIEMIAIHTPGHSDDHLCFQAGAILFTGDHIMGGSSVMVERLRPYMRSLERLQGMAFDRLYPGHGPEIESPSEVISWYLAHRREREAQILHAVAVAPRTVEEVVEVVYADVDESLHPLAARSVLAHLQKLEEEARVQVEGRRWSVVSPAG
ncbi:MAG: MBL fold metallo-hydrolase [Acidimicrobiia bacterium]|nr:MBL fold metallo-hydrolase [Acidimicrobiia bacterium]MDH4308420.1 MBL fold metallo-hydrolase [Acidimicrobiia bacterium]MDH5294552.1 MBL fold metallo-hydrolase [Acidimicrobiia bacterium]